MSVAFFFWNITPNIFSEILIDLFEWFSLNVRGSIKTLEQHFKFRLGLLVGWEGVMKSWLQIRFSCNRVLHISCQICRMKMSDDLIISNSNHHIFSSQLTVNEILQWFSRYLTSLTGNMGHLWHENQIHNQFLTLAVQPPTAQKLLRLSIQTTSSTKSSWRGLSKSVKVYRVFHLRKKKFMQQSG